MPEYRFGFNGQEKPACRNLSAGRDDKIAVVSGSSFAAAHF
ncbi:MAG: hypothetical protein ABIJ16_02010 [Bacteroidota bacterium]